MFTKGLQKAKITLKYEDNSKKKNQENDDLHII